MNANGNHVLRRAPSAGLAHLLALAVAAIPAAATAADIAAGRAILEANCARCHAVGLTGESPLAKAPAFRTLKKRYPIESLAEALAEGIVTGHPGMPQFTFSPSEIDAILGYLNSLDTP